MLLENKMISLLNNWIRTDEAKSGQGWFHILLVPHLGDDFSRHFIEESCMGSKMGSKMVKHEVCCMLCNKTERLGCKELEGPYLMPPCGRSWNAKAVVMAVDFLKSPKELVKECGSYLMSY